MSLNQNTPQDLVKEFTNISSNELYDYTHRSIKNLNVSTEIAHILNSALWVFGLAIVIFIVDWITNKFILKLVIKLIKKSKTNIDDFLINNKTLKYIGHYVPLSVTKLLIPIVFRGFPKFTEALVTIINIMMVITLIRILKSIFRSIRDIMRTKPAFADKPIDSYLQVIDMFLLFLGGTIIFSIITGGSPWTFVGSLGAASAILMLVFKDTILGFVASVQVSSNDSIRVGDWIEMTKHGADGDVIEINLNNIKVQNFDKTITTIPTHLLLSDAFKNWRGMQESGGRRIKRSIHLKISSIRFLSNEEIKDLEKIQLLQEFIKNKKEELQRHNKNQNLENSIPVNGRHMTNIGLFRAYVMFYCRNNPGINQTMTLLVRQLAPTDSGLPLELYMFSNDTRWANYESIMADIFDHLLAAVKYFHLEVFESPASDDIRKVNFALKETISTDL